MSVLDVVRRLLLDPRARGLDLDSEAATRVHASMIRGKPFLNRLYRDYYREFEQAHHEAPDGARLEIGSGGGFLDEVVPDLLTLDLRPGADVGCVASALELPLAAGSTGAIFLLNVLHHLAEPRCFFAEAARVLRPGGRIVLIEPYVSPFARLVYTHLHHEPFDPAAATWDLCGEGPMTVANGALPWVILVRDRGRFEREFPALEIRRIVPHTVALHLVSGGVSMRSLAPGIAFAPLRAAETMLGPLRRFLATMMTVEIVRTG